MKNLKRFLLALCVTFPLVACGGKVAADKPKIPQTVRTTMTEYEDDNGFYTWHGTIDGKECIEISTQWDKSVAISCNWSAR